MTSGIGIFIAINDNSAYLPKVFLMLSSVRHIALFLLFPFTIHAQSTEPLKIPQITAEMLADGKLDEPFWQQAAVTELIYETDPGENIPASVRTKVYIVDAGTSFRVAFEAFDPDPKKIINPLRDRDKAFNDDLVGFQLDTFDTNQRALWFFVSARGVQMDGTYDESRNNDDDSWDAIWDSGAQLTTQGYTVEFEIPYSSLKFKQTTTAQQWSIKFSRFRPRENNFRYGNVINDRNNNCNLCQQAKIIGFANVQAGRNLLVNPTFTSNYSEARTEPNQSFSSDNTNEFGLDVTWSPTPNHTISGTYNPDFSQIEIDNAQLNVNTNFALFYPEKRPFFLDSADFFESPSRLVYTRNIADPDYGLRSTGRIGEHTYGLFGALDAQTNILRPGPFRSSRETLDTESVDLVGTYRYGFGESSNIGTIFTSRSADDYSSVLASIDGTWQKNSHTLVAQWMSSSTDDVIDDNFTSFTGNAYLINYTYRDREKTLRLVTNSYDPGFRADMGFIGQVDVKKSVVGAAYRWYPVEKFFNEIEVYSDWDITHQISIDREIEQELEASISANGKMLSHIELGLGQRTSFWKDVYYDQTFYFFYGEFTPIANWEFSLFHRGGDQIDYRNNALGTINTFEPGVTGIINNNVSLSLSYVDESLERLGGSVYHAKLLDTRLSWQFNLRQRLRLAIQYGNTDLDMTLDKDYMPGDATTANYNDIGTQLVYSYKINPRTVFYAGYSDNYIGYTENDITIDTYQTERSLFLKFGYAWQP
ncbi:MAG TPA: DUF5916 domain-containing protein [Arenimonas sp.]|nr:DUF5916 domain-containing protein [Arenimonas sp.]